MPKTLAGGFGTTKSRAQHQERPISVIGAREAIAAAIL